MAIKKITEQWENLKDLLSTDTKTKNLRALKTLGIKPEEYHVLLVNRVNKRRPKAITHKVEGIQSPMDQFCSEIRASYKKNKTLNHHSFKHRDVKHHIDNAIMDLSEMVEGDSEAIIKAARNLYYAYFVANNSPNQASE